MSKQIRNCRDCGDPDCLYVGMDQKACADFVEREDICRDALNLAECRPTSLDEGLYQWAVDAEEMLRKLVKERKSK